MEKASSEGKSQQVEYTELKRESEEDKIKLGLTFKKPVRPSTSTYVRLRKFHGKKQKLLSVIQALENVSSAF